jgi:hypothetical protein
MLSRVTVARTDVSEERIASIMTVTRIGELGTTLAVSGNRSTLRITLMICSVQVKVNDHFLFPFHGNYIQTVRFFFYGTASLKRGRICNWQFLLSLASAVSLGCEYRVTHYHTFLSQF